jgi:hypothetical protein
MPGLTLAKIPSQHRRRQEGTRAAARQKTPSGTLPEALAVSKDSAPGVLPSLRHHLPPSLQAPLISWQMSFPHPQLHLQCRLEIAGVGLTCSGWKLAQVA